MTKRLTMATMLAGLTLLSFAQKDDFGYDLGIEGETSIVKGWKLSLDASMRTQDNARQVERFALGADVSHKLYQTDDKTFAVKAIAGGEWQWTKRLGEVDYKYFKADNELVEDGFAKEGTLRGWNTTDRYWRNRLRLSAALSANYAPNKRWSFTLRESVFHTHYFTISPSRLKYRADEYNSVDENGDILIDNEGYVAWIYTPYTYDDNYIDDTHTDADGNIIGKSLSQDFDTKRRKDRTVLRSKLTVSYDIKGFPLDIFASADYGCGLNYKANKWKFSGGYDYKINKKQKLTMFYRYTIDNGDGDINGHLVGVGYKFNF